MKFLASRGSLKLAGEFSVVICDATASQTTPHPGAGRFGASLNPVGYAVARLVGLLGYQTLVAKMQGR